MQLGFIRSYIAVAIVIIIVAGSISAQADLSDPTISVHYGFEGDGNTIVDGSINGNHGKIVGNIVRAKGVYGKAAVFDGSSSIDMNGPEFKNGPVEGFTLAFWVKHTGSTAPQTMFDALTSSYSDRLFQIEIRPTGIRFYCRNEKGQLVFNISPGPIIPANEWVHFAGTYDSTRKQAKLYVNGKHTTSGHIFASGVRTISNNWDVYAGIGQHKNDHWFNGMLDEFFIFNRAVSASEITDIMNGVLTPAFVPVYRVKLQGKDELMGETTDPVKGVSYVLIITNEGNTEDTFLLGFSEKVGVEGTVRGVFTAGVETVIITRFGDRAGSTTHHQVTLAPGASTEVEFNVAGDSFTKPGEYEIKVNATSKGDSTKSAEVTTTTTILPALPVYGVTLVNKGDESTGETEDAVAGVSYVLIITNEGNTEDTFLLGFSEKVGVEGTVRGVFTAGVETVIITRFGDRAGSTTHHQVTLAPGASTEVEFNVAGDSFTKPGEYEIKVNATSKGDSTKSAEVTTTTTILPALPVYGVTLVNKGDESTGETEDAVAGVSYVLIITNEGNTEDTFLLGFSEKVGVEGTVRGVFTAGVETVIITRFGDRAGSTTHHQVTLAPGASTEVEFNVAGDSFTKPGEYEIKVNATSKGDSTKSAEVTTTTTILPALPVYGVTLVNKGDESTGETEDAVAGVTYTLSVLNIGNTEDTIVLGSSAEVGIEGSVLGTFKLTADQEIPTGQLEVELAGHTSRDVLFTVAGDSFTEPGEYEVSVTATSKGDSTKTAEVTTTTTILPVYRVKLQGKDGLMGETTDPVKGVSYVLIVTNEGNTEDTFLLGSSAKVGVEGTVRDSFTAGVDDVWIQTSDDQGRLVLTREVQVMLAPGASTEVTFTVAGDSFTKPGEYEFKVNVTSKGDITKSAEVTTTTTILPIYGFTLASVGDTTTETSDVSEGISYTLKLTNSGNADDVITLATTGTPASLSQNEVSLAHQASAEVVLTITGDDLAKAGDYEVKVTATSQGDDTITQAITTTTTILPVYGVTLESKSPLTGSTQDSVAGVTYTLTVTNIGNTEDTIILSSSAEVDIDGAVRGAFKSSVEQEIPTNQIEVTLASGTSTEVTFTAAGDVFTKPGEFVIVVTATSKSDRTKIAEIRTETTITPVPWDLNADGTVNILDLVQVSNQIGESGEGLAGDVNMDGTVNILDLVQVASYFGKSHFEIVQENQ